MEGNAYGLSRLQYNCLFAALLCSIFLTQLDQTIVSTALPTIATELNGFSSMSWVFTIYMLASTAMMPIAGKLSDLYGRRLFLLMGLILFVGGSLLCGMAQTMTQLIVFRGLKGIGAGFLMPITFTVVFSVMPRGNNKYQSLYMSVFALSSVVGPTIGALITTLLDWRYIFYINLPLGLIVFAAFLKLLPRDEGSSSYPTKSIGYLAPILLITGTLCTLLALKLGGVQYAWGSLEIMSLLVVGIITLTSFVMQQIRAGEPVIPFHLFRDRVIASTYITTFVQGIIMFSALVYVPMFVQGSLGGDVAYTGGALTPLMLCVMFGATLCGMLIQRYTWRFSMALSMMLCTVSLLLMIYLPDQVSFLWVCIIMMLLGLGIGMMMMIGQTAVSMSVDESIRGAATSSVSFFRSIGGVLGTAVLTTLVNHKLSRLMLLHEGELSLPADEVGVVTDPLALLESNTNLPPHQQELLQSILGESVQYGFWFLAIAAVIGFVVSFWAGSARQQANHELIAAKIDPASAH
ncbi:MFS transporter [Paenibacillus septentrionalis]|uniref:MFS transporter n=1 Tax=Paenibacillus septentrionalis TaxID=429342 RepID=A0ABW1V6U1_9BACL